MRNSTRFVGSEVHKDSVAVAIAEGKGSEVTFFGVIPNDPLAVKKLAKKLSTKGAQVKFC